MTDLVTVAVPGLPTAGPITGSELVPVHQNGRMVRVRQADLTNGGAAFLDRVASVALERGTCVVGDGPARMTRADVFNPDHCGRLLGVLAQDVAKGVSGRVQSLGPMAGLAVPVSTDGDELFVGAGGALVRVLPAGATWRQIVARSDAATSILIAPGEASGVSEDADFLLAEGGFATPATPPDIEQATPGRWIDPRQLAEGISSLAFRAGRGEFQDASPAVYAASRALLGVFYPIVALGFIGDGQTHPLSSVTQCQGRDTAGWSLFQWQGLFPRARTLDDEIDGHAIQRLADGSPKGTEIRFPPASVGLCTLPIYTDGPQSMAYVGPMRDRATLRAITPGADLLVHGLNTPATGPFETRSLALECGGTGTAATNFAGGCARRVIFNPTAGVASWCDRASDLLIQGAGDQRYNYWAQPTYTKNMQRGLRWTDVVTFGQAFQIRPTDAFTFDADHACFSYFFQNCMAVGYNFGWQYLFNGRINGNCHEGVTLYNCQAYSGRGMLRAFNRLGGYKSPEWIIISPGFQGIGAAFDLTQLYNVEISGAPLLVTDSGTTPGRLMISIVDCTDVSIENACLVTAPLGDSSIGFNQGPVSGVTGIYVGGAATEHVHIEKTALINYQQWDQVIYIAPEVFANKVRERSTYVHETGGSLAYGMVVDASGKQNCAAPLDVLNRISPTYRASVDDNGLYCLSGRVQVVTDANGRASIPFPMRPATNTPYFIGGEPIIAVSLRNAALGDNAVPPSMARTSGSPSGFAVKLSAPNATFDIEFSANGK